MEPTAAVPGSRRVLRRLRDVMAGSGTAQQRLNEIVLLIAGEMVAEVCSIYVMRAGEVLELFATEGLRPEAVHRTRLRVGEGLVGVIAATARSLALADAQAHPDFAYRPETGEEVYHSLMGVPVLRGGRVLGVVVVQNRTLRHYTEDEVEAMQTIAMILAELVASGELVNPLELQPANGNGILPVRLDGVRMHGGLALGTAVLHEPRILIRQVVAENPQAELGRLRGAIAAVQKSIDEMLSSGIVESGEPREILESFRMFAADRGWMHRMSEAVRGGLTAEAAVQKVQDESRARLLQASDPYLRERLADLEDLANRLQQHLAGRPLTSAAAALPEEFILVARSMGPAELLDYDRARLKGIVLEEGSPTAHVAIVARALDIPAIGRVRNVLERIDAGDVIAIDCEEQAVFVRPSEDVQQAVERRINIKAGERRRYAELRELPAETRDGVRVSLQLNSGLAIDLPFMEMTGAQGIGLFRTELQYMLRERFPTVEEQAQLYGRVLDQAGDRPVTFRTLDAGGDKLLPYMPDAAGEENPAMGWRAIRIALDRPALLRQQLRALIRAASGRRLRVMFPMIAELAELEAARAILELELERAWRRDTDPPPVAVQVGVMLEVPSLLFELDQVLPRVDFLSVGTNDLTQFFFASDRGNPRLAARYDSLSPTLLRALRQVTAMCLKHHVELSLCGEMAGDPLDAAALVGIGFRTLSMTPASIGPVKAMIRSLHMGALGEFLAAWETSPTRSLRDKLRDFCADHGVEL
ncbi:MAG TPA: phosphoenolpyruvate--protein phosphotransferase [Stellaceae bacterium]|nr:phosphoenolpyruvate--protein phosphotransferase [Stellaceae bacterium]